MASDDREYGNPFYAQIITANDDCRQLWENILPQPYHATEIIFNTQELEKFYIENSLQPIYTYMQDYAQPIYIATG